MIKHKDVIIQVTFTAKGKRYEDYALQSADYVFVQTVNPCGYRFEDLAAVKKFLKDQAKLVKANNDDDPFSYLKACIVGTSWRGVEENEIGVWGRRWKRPEFLLYKDINIERVAAFDRATDTWTDITKEFMAVWDLGRNPPKRIRRREYVAAVRFPGTVSFHFTAPDNLTPAELKKVAADAFWDMRIDANAYDIANWSGVKVTGIELDDEDED